MNHYNIGILFADNANSGLTHDFFSGILDSFKRGVEACGYDLMFLNGSDERPNRMTYLEKAKQKELDGIFIACIDFENPEVKELLASGIPIVTIDEEADEVLSISSDNVGGICNMVKYLIEMGHKKIAYIHGDVNTVTNIRLDGFRKTMEGYGLKVPQEYILPSSFRDMEKAAYYTESLLRLPEPPSCIIYSDDYAAIGGMNIIHARGLSIPDDISVVGYDGINLVSKYEPRLTTIKQDTTTMGLTAAKKLMEMIENPGIVEKRTIIINTILEKGRTVAKNYKLD